MFENHNHVNGNFYLVCLKLYVTYKSKNIAAIEINFKRNKLHQFSLRTRNKKVANKKNTNISQTLCDSIEKKLETIPNSSIIQELQIPFWTVWLIFGAIEHSLTATTHRWEARSNHTTIRQLSIFRIVRSFLANANRIFSSRHRNIKRWKYRFRIRVGLFTSLTRAKSTNVMVFFCFSFFLFYTLFFVASSPHAMHRSLSISYTHTR